jgi:hypothetical protein
MIPRRAPAVSSADCLVDETMALSPNAALQLTARMPRRRLLVTTHAACS